ncbi:MAG: response regulator [Anaerolineae bacterium]|nr:response regulator [Anaerolineae bacterium]
MNQNITTSHVLIVDDDPDLTYIISMGLAKFDDYSVIDVAHNGKEAVAKIQEKSYDLVITDYHMPDMSGFDVAESVRKHSPKAQVMLMTAYGSSELQAEAVDVMDGYINKPFTISQIREIVEDTLNSTKNVPQSDDSVAYGIKSDEHLNKLQVNTSAQCVLLIESTGYTVRAVGTTAGLDTDSISALVAANFTASTKLATLLGSKNSIFKSSFYEGIDYNVYSYDINGRLLLAVIFGATAKPGVVWYYTKQTAAALEKLYENEPVKLDLGDDDISGAFSLELDNLFDNVEDDSLLEEEHPVLVEIAPEPKQDNPPQPKAQKDNPPQPKAQKEFSDQPMTFEQAVAAGLVPQIILQREQMYCE